MFILDTNVLSEVRKSSGADRNVAAWMASNEPSNFYISAITVMELQIGALGKLRSDPQQGARLQNWIDKAVLLHFRGRILPIDESVAMVCAGLHVPDKRAERDALIAATAIVHRMTVVTRNIKDFAPAGVKTLNPWLAQ